MAGASVPASFVLSGTDFFMYVIRQLLFSWASSEQGFLLPFFDPFILKLKTKK